MNTKNDYQLIEKKSDHRLTPRIGPESRQLLSLGQKRGWDFTILGRAPLPREHVRLGDWLIVPAHQDNSLIPQRAFDRVQSIFAVGIRPKGFVIVHEAPQLLSGPQQIKERPSLFPNLTPALKVVGGVLGTLAVVTLGIGGLAVVFVAGAALALPAVIVAGAIVLDPILIAVTDDDTWIEIDRWLVS